MEAPASRKTPWVQAVPVALDRRAFVRRLGAGAAAATLGGAGFAPATSTPFSGRSVPATLPTSSTSRSGWAES